MDDYGFADASFKTSIYPDKHLNPPPTPFFDSLAKAGIMLSASHRPLSLSHAPSIPAVPLLAHQVLPWPRAASRTT